NAASPPATNWTMSAQIGGTPGAPNFPGPGATTTITVLVRIDEVWKYQNSGNDPETAWRGTAFDDTAWPTGRALFYAGNAQPPAGEFQSIPTLFSTGVDDSHNALSPGVPDPHYRLTVSAQSTPPPPPIAATVIQNHPAWLANDALSSWIGPVDPGTANVAPGEYRFRTAFNLSSFDPATVQITLSVAADNRLNDVLINGASSGISFVGFNGFSQDFVITNGFVNGTNTLEFVAFNDATTPNPAGFRARLSGTAQALLPQNTQLNPGPVTAYFRATFTFTGNPTATLLKLRPMVDDGAVIARDDTTANQFVFPASQPIAAGAYLSLNETQLGFHPQSGDKLFLYPPNRSSVIDAVVVKKTLRGRYPDATGRWLYPAQPTPGSSNVFAFHDEIVINEIMYHHRGLPATPEIYQDTTLLPVAAAWKYDQSGLDLGAAWR